MGKKKNISYTEKTKEDDVMNAQAMKIDNNFFNEFLKLNKGKIDSITPKKPTIVRGDEWDSETCWDEDYKEIDAI